MPSAFYNTYSFAHQPALRIKPGDRVVTRTIDASGVDWNGKPVGREKASERDPMSVAPKTSIAGSQASGI